MMQSAIVDAQRFTNLSSDSGTPMRYDALVQMYPACRTLPRDAYVAPSEYHASQESGWALTEASAWEENSVASLTSPSTMSGSRTSSFLPPSGPESFIVLHPGHTQ